MVWTPAAVRARLGHVVLDAPDVPTLYFRRTVGHLAAVGVRVLHLFNPLDEAIEVSRLRRNADKPYPGQAAIVTARGVRGRRLRALRRVARRPPRLRPRRRLLHDGPGRKATERVVVHVRERSPCAARCDVMVLSRRALGSCADCPTMRRIDAR